ncbi:MAG: hypothetical protein N7Q72_07045, partial [Spiroplasma sp. Tabriz.8]|nr:hypothetical protein [Spiroplasma sp. Tabriz.8]
TDFNSDLILKLLEQVNLYLHKYSLSNQIKHVFYVLQIKYIYIYIYIYHSLKMDIFYPNWCKTFLCTS